MSGTPRTDALHWGSGTASRPDYDKLWVVARQLERELNTALDAVRDGADLLAGYASNQDGDIFTPGDNQIDHWFVEHAPIIAQAKQRDEHGRG